VTTGPRLTVLLVVVLASAVTWGHGELSKAADVTGGQVTVARWKTAIRDAYDGHLDRHYSCAVVAAAVARLPVAMISSNVFVVLQRYERRIC
jgi:hypothetical protein